MARSRTRRGRRKFATWNEVQNTTKQLDAPVEDTPVVVTEENAAPNDVTTELIPPPEKLVVNAELVEPEPLTRVEEEGDIYWINEAGQLHRTLGPAVIFANGTKVWYQHGKRHRLDGPALESGSGYQAWYRNDLRHRVNGPAVTWLSGEVEYWLDGERVTRKQAENAAITESATSTTSTTVTRDDDEQ